MNQSPSARPGLALPDMPLLISLCMLCAAGLAVLYGVGGENPELLRRQSVRIGLAFSVMIVFACIPPALLLRASPHVYAAAIVLLVVVLAAGSSAKGAQRWLDFGGFRFQPAELMKIALPMMVAWTLTRFSLPPRLPALSLALLVAALPAALIVSQPDLGTAVLILLTGLIVIFLAGVSWRAIAAFAFSLGALLPLLWMVMLHDYQRRRILTLFDPWSDPLGAGYHTIQSIIAVGSGGWRGKGWLAGTQSRLDFIPETATDFIFAVYAEEFGLLGALFLLALYLFIAVRGLVIALRAQETYARLLGGCLAVGFFLQVFFNIGMVVGILPVVGVPLPVMSFGGSSMLITLISFGILMSISRQGGEAAR